MSRSLMLIVHNVRSTHNVGSLLRTADGLGVDVVYLTGYTPYPEMSDDTRLPHLIKKINKQVSKTALGAERSVRWRQCDDIEIIINNLREAGYQLAALEQAADSINLAKYTVPEKLALIVGREVEGIEQAILQQIDIILEIPMLGHKESFNVAQAAAMALYYCRYSGNAK